MLRILFTLCFSVVFFACSSDSGNGDDTSSSAGNGGGGKSSGSNSGLGSHLALPSNVNKSAITAKYNAWIGAYYATYQDDVNDGTLDPGLAKEGMEDAARIKWVSGSADNVKQTVSEGIGYGMLLTSLNGDFARFDKLWKYHKAFRRSGTELMMWKVFSFRSVLGDGVATDADIDVIAALLIAYKKTNKQEYLNDAIAIGRSMYDIALTDDKLLLPAQKTNGMFTGSKGQFINISYLSLAAMKMLAEHDTERDWNEVLNANINYMQMVQNAGKGLWPDWSKPDGTAFVGNGDCDNLTIASSAGGGSVQSCLVYSKEGARTPWRIAWYYHWYGDSKAKEMLDKAFAFVSGQTGSDPNAIKSWYAYDDDKIAMGGATANARMWASICATGLGSANNSAWNTTCNEKILAKDLSTANYYDDSLLLLYQMLFNGNFEL